MSNFKNVELSRKANIYFDGNVTSRTFITEDGEEKSLGIMMPGEYNFGTNAPELMEITNGDVEVKLDGNDVWNTYKGGSSFEVLGNSSFDIKVKIVTDYCCSYIK